VPATITVLKVVPQRIRRAVYLARACGQRRSDVVKFGKTTYYHYCEMPKPIVDEWLAASSMGQFYNARIKGTGKDGPYDCRTHQVPNY
jgi:hypothetical protein